MNNRKGNIPGTDLSAYAAAKGMTSDGWRANANTGAAIVRSSIAGNVRRPAMTTPRCTARAIAAPSRAPTACATMGSSTISVPMAKTAREKKYRLPRATAASA
jgi:hypothetical protein